MKQKNAKNFVKKSILFTDLGQIIPNFAVQNVVDLFKRISLRLSKNDILKIKRLFQTDCVDGLAPLPWLPSFGKY